MENDSKARHFMNACPSCGGIIDVSSCDPYSKVLCPTCSKAIRVRADFLHFRIEKKIGEGGLSRVFRAVDQTLGRLVALKVLNPDFSKDSKRAAEFEREAKITAAISHPNVVKVFSAGRDQDHYFMAMELVGGGSLDDMIHSEGKMSEKRVLEIGADLVEGMNAAHKVGLIHRDMKPGNVLFSEEGISKIVDFGLARSVLGLDAEQGEMWATPYYVPPEKLYDAREDFRSDIYSLGATLFHALAGEPTCPSDTPSIEELRLLKERSVSLEMSAPHVSVPACELIDRMMARNPEDRYASYHELSEHFSLTRKKLSGESNSSAAPLRIEKETTKSKFREISLKFCSVAIGALLIAVTVYFFNQSGKKPGPGMEAGEDRSSVVVEDGEKTTTERFAGAMKMLVLRDFGSAERVFGEIASASETRQPTANWSLFNQGLSLLLQGDLKRARAIFERLDEGSMFSEQAADKKLCGFFKNASELLIAQFPVKFERRAKFQENSFESSALLACGIKNWEMGAIDEAEGYFLCFAKEKLPEDYSWMSDLKLLLDPYMGDLKLLRAFPPFDRQTDHKEALAALESSQKMYEKMETKIAKERIRKRVKHLQGVVAKLEVEEREAEELRLAQLRIVELRKMIDLSADIEKYRSNLRFVQGLNVIKINKFKHPEFVQRHTDYTDVWKSAESFIQDLIADINRYGYFGPVKQRSGLFRSLNIVSADRDQLTHIFGEAQGRASIPIEQVSGRSLITIAEGLSDRLTDKEEIQKRVKQRVLFAYLMGEWSVAVTLSAEVKDEPFRALWSRILEAERRS